MMDLQFDKEMDSLLRARGVPLGDTSPKGHLDADEIAAFAENAMPQRTRALHLAHIADCDRCRKILSNVIAVNAEAEPEMAAAAVPAAAVPPTPWYRKLFVFPNLAYAMGGLVLLFGGLITLSIFNGISGDAGVAVSQMSESEAARGPSAPSDSQLPAASADAASTANVAASNSNAASSTAASSPSGSADAAPGRPALAMNAANGAYSVDGATSDTAVAAAPAPKPAQPVAAPPPPMAEVSEPKDTERAREDDKAADAEEKSKNLSLSAKKRVELMPDSRNAPRTQAGGQAKSVPGPTRDMQQTFPNRADNTYELRSRRVGGKDFQFRSGAWYDTAYRSQPTINVRRGSEEFGKLDGGLRSVANTLSGVVVVVWGAKAYRIQ